MKQNSPQNIVFGSETANNIIWTSQEIVNHANDNGMTPVEGALYTVTIGSGTNDGIRGVALGNQAEVDEMNGIAVGFTSVSSDKNSLSFGSNTYSGGVQDVILGHNSGSNQNNASVLGGDSSGNASSTTIGNNAVTSAYGVSIGNNIRNATNGDIVLSTSNSNNVSYNTVTSKWIGQPDTYLTHFIFQTGTTPKLKYVSYRFNASSVGEEVVSNTANFQDILQSHQSFGSIYSNTVTIAQGTTSKPWNYCEIDSKQHFINGFLKEIKVSCGSSGTYTNDYIYLAVWELDDKTNEYRYVGHSINSEQFAYGAIYFFTFRNEALKGNKIRIYPITEEMINAGNYKDGDIIFNTLCDVAADGTKISYIGVLSDFSPNLEIELDTSIVSGYDYRLETSSEDTIHISGANPSFAPQNGKNYILDDGASSLTLVVNKNSNKVSTCTVKVNNISVTNLSSWLTISTPVPFLYPFTVKWIGGTQGVAGSSYEFIISHYSHSNGNQYVIVEPRMTDHVNWIVWGWQSDALSRTSSYPKFAKTPTDVLETYDVLDNFFSDATTDTTPSSYFKGDTLPNWNFMNSENFLNFNRSNPNTVHASLVAPAATTINNAFRNNTNLEDVIIDIDAVYSAGNLCQNCQNLRRVHFNGSGAANTIAAAFYDCKKLAGDVNLTIATNNLAQCFQLATQSTRTESLNVSIKNVGSSPRDLIITNFATNNANLANLSFSGFPAGSGFRSASAPDDFSGCINLESVGGDGPIALKYSHIGKLFEDCPKLSQLHLDFSAATNQASVEFCQNSILDLETIQKMGNATYGLPVDNSEIYLGISLKKLKKVADPVRYPYFESGKVQYDAIGNVVYLTESGEETIIWNDAAMNDYISTSADPDVDYLTETGAIFDTYYPTGELLDALRAIHQKGWYPVIRFN